MRLQLHLGFALTSVVALGSSVQALPVTLVDNSTPGYSTVAWSEQSGVADTFNSNQGFNSASGNVAASTNYTFSGLTPGGQSNVFATWRQAGQANVANSVPYTISDGGGVVNVNQQAVAGPARNLILRDTNGSGTQYFEFQKLATITDNGNGIVNASIGVSTGFSLSDAIVVAEIPTNLTIIDNGDAGFTSSGFTSQAGVDAFSSDQAFNNLGTADNANWTFNGLAAGTYEVFVTSDQTGQANLTTAAPFTVSDGGGLSLVNQEVGPNPDLILADLDGINLSFLAFQKLATVLVLDGQLQVTLNSVVGGTSSDFVFADGVAIRLVSVYVPEPASVVLLGLAGAALLRRRRHA